MADTTVMVAKSKEQVAFDLMHDVLRSEGLYCNPNPAGGFKPATREQILDTYADCFRAAGGMRWRSGS